MLSETRTGGTSQRLRVDRQSCDGSALCAKLLPDVIRMDEWGFPIVQRPVPEHLVATARTAVSACPRLALQLRAP